MKKVFYTTLLLALCLSSEGQAETRQQLTIGQQQVDKFVTELCFDHDAVTLTYAEGGSETVADMEQVEITLSYGSTGIDHATVSSRKDTSDKVFSLDGQYVGTAQSKLSKGVYIMNGKKKIIK